MGAPTAHAATLRLRNARPDSVEYLLEPWGEVYEPRAGATLTLISSGPTGGYVEVVFGEERVTTWSDTGSTATLECDHEFGLYRGPRPPVPPYPLRVSRATPPLRRPAAHRVELALHNDGAYPLALWTTPQSDQYTLSPGAKRTVLAEGETAGPVELELRRSGVLVSSWPALRIAVLEEKMR